MRVGFIGTGSIGLPMARTIQRAGFEMTVHDRRREATDEPVANGATWADSPRDVAAVSDVVLTSLPGPKEVEEVALGAAGIHEGLHAGMVYVDLSTSTPTLIRAIAASFATAGVDVLDAPVSGGAVGAERGTLAVFTGGEDSVIERIHPVLDALGNVMRCGPLGAGELVKLCNNLIGHVVMATLPEAFALGAKGGVTPQALFEAISGGLGNTAMMQLWLPRVFTGTDRQAIPTPGVMLKDMRITLQLAEELGVPAAMCEASERRFTEAWDHGYAEDIIRLVETQAGVTLRGSGGADAPTAREAGSAP